MDQTLPKTDPTKVQTSSLADDIVQSKKDLAQATTGGQVSVNDTGAIGLSQLPAEPVGGPKEQKEAGPLAPRRETIRIIEQKEPEPGKEVKDWVEKVEEGETAQLGQTITDDYGQVLVEAAEKKKPKIVLPLDEAEIEKGLHHKAVDSIRWLAEWCIRVMKMAAGRVFYRQTS